VLKAIQKAEDEEENESAISKIKEWQQSVAQANRRKAVTSSKIRVLR
jgi:hypothetical protein